MLKLTKAKFTAARNFILSSARPLERALFHFYFESGPAQEVLDELRHFQNADGGFGYGVEPDLPMADSSVINTVRCLQILAMVRAPSENPMVRDAVRYLLDAYDPETAVWEIVPRVVNRGPHAPWWHYDDEGQAAKWGGYLVNPRAEVLGCLYDFADLVPKNLIVSVTDLLLAHLESHPDMKDMHEIACYLELLETRSLPEACCERLAVGLAQPVAGAVQRDPDKWDGYCLKPTGYMGVVRSPGSPFAGMLDAEVDLSLDYDIRRQQPDGSWHPNWTWGDAFPDAWKQARCAWQGILTVKMLKTLASFGRLE